MREVPDDREARREARRTERHDEFRCVVRDEEGELQWAPSELARYLQNSGLLARINETVLHPVGMALAVDAKTDEISDENDAGTVVGLSLIVTDDPEGIVFTNEQRRRSRRRQREAGQLTSAAEALRE